MFSGTVWKVDVGDIIVFYSLSLLCIVSFLNFCSLASFTLTKNVLVVECLPNVRPNILPLYGMI